MYTINYLFTYYYSRKIIKKYIALNSITKFEKNIILYMGIMALYFSCRSFIFANIIVSNR